jgi:hypothetical protein
MLLDLGDPVVGVVKRLTAAGGREDELGPLSVPRLGAPDSRRLQVADQLGGCGQAQLVSWS